MTPFDMKEIFDKLSQFRLKLARGGRASAKSEIDALVFAVGKQVPKPITLTRGGILGKNQPIWTCRCCGRELHEYNAPYCSRCGQALNWSFVQ